MKITWSDVGTVFAFAAVYGVSSACGLDGWRAMIVVTLAAVVGMFCGRRS